MSHKLGLDHSIGAIRIAVAAAVLAWCPSTFASTLTLDVNQYEHKAWRVADGFAKGAIYSVAQTPDGYLWIGTEFGLLRFDGIRTTAWPLDGILASAKVQNLLTGPDGTLWIGTSKGLASWKDGKLTLYAELMGRIVDRLLADRHGTLWVRRATLPTSDLCAIRDGGVRCWGDDSGFGARVTIKYEDRKGQLWFGEPHGVWQWNDGDPRFYPLPRDRFLQALIDDSDGALLVVLSGTMHRMVDGKLSEVYRLPGASGRLATNVALLRDRDGSLWIGTLGGGLVHVQGGRIDQFSHADGLSSDAVAGLFQDREGNIWVSTHAGLDRFRTLPVTPFTVRQGFSSLYVTAVVASPDGSIWLRTIDGVNHWKDGHVTVYPALPGLSSGTTPPDPAAADSDTGNVTGLSGGSLFQDERGRVWVSTVRSIGYFERDRFHVVPGVPGGRVHAITGDLKGNLWLAYETQGLLKLAGNRVVDQIPWTRLGHSDYAGALAVDPSTGGLWLGFFRGGLAFVKNGQAHTSYGDAQGLAPGRVNDLRFGRDGSLWAATEGGINRLKDARISTLSSLDGLPCDDAHWTMEDDAGHFWVSMPCGLVRIARNELEAWLDRADSQDSQKRIIPVTVFARSDGVRNRATVGAYSPHAAKDTAGRIWFFPLEGLSVIDPRGASLAQPFPAVNVEQITADRTAHDPSSVVNGRVQLSPLVRDLEIDYTAFSFAAPENIRFRYRLEGHDNDWHDVGTRRQAFYTDLRPGAYQFRVTASTLNGVWGERGAEVNFSIAPAYYQTAWFRALMAIAAASLLWAAYRYRLRQVAHEFEVRLQGRVNERTRIARDLHDTLLQSLHGLLFRFQAANNMLPDRPVEAKQKLESAIDQAAQALTEGRDAVQDLRSVATDTEDLAVALTMLSQELAANEIDGRDAQPIVNVAVQGTPRALHPVLRDDVYRIAGEALRNAFRHAHARHIEVEFRYEEKQLQLRVRDDGSGIDEKVLEDHRTRGHFGLPGMRERADLIGGRLDVWTQVGIGTEVDLKVPEYAAYAVRPGRSWIWSLGRRTGTPS